MTRQIILKKKNKHTEKNVPFSGKSTKHFIDAILKKIALI